jgi:hypothetical protein
LGYATNESLSQHLSALRSYIDHYGLIGAINGAAVPRKCSNSLIAFWCIASINA